MINVTIFVCEKKALKNEYSRFQKMKKKFSLKALKMNLVGMEWKLKAREEKRG
jgi:hypothetical protein